MKTKTIKLSDGWGPSNPQDINLKSEEAWRKACRFRVEQLTETAEFYIGQYLERSEVEQLCAANDWKVTIAAKPKS